MFEIEFCTKWSASFYAVFRNSKFFWKITNMNRSLQEDVVFLEKTHFPTFKASIGISVSKGCPYTAAKM